MEKDKKSPFDKADSSAAIRERWLAEKQDRATLAQIEKNVHKKRFEGRSRLVAALHVRRLYQQAREAEHDRGSIIVAINKKVGGSNFRIDKWMMPRNIEGIDNKIVQEYKDKKTLRNEPQKRVSSYLKIVEAIAELLGKDAKDLKIQLLKATSFEGFSKYRKQKTPTSLPDIEPAQELADLLQGCAHFVAHSIDFAALIQKAERLQAGWNLHDGPEAKLLMDYQLHEPLNVRKPATKLVAEYFALPPYPATPLARIPFACLDTDICIETEGRATPELGPRPPSQGSEEPDFAFRILPARLVAYWDLYLAVAPVGTLGVGAVFLINSSVNIGLPGDDALAGNYWMPVRDFYELTHNIVPHQIEKDGWRRVLFQLSDDILEKVSYNLLTEQVDRLNLTPPSHVVPTVYIHPVDAYHVEQWLRRDLTLRLQNEHGEEELEIGKISCLEAHAVDDVVTWNTGASSLARHVEAALHAGTIEKALIDWAIRYRTSLQVLEEQWVGNAAEAEAQLRQRWREAAKKEDQA